MKMPQSLYFAAAILALTTIPCVAQINHGLDFTTDFPFYVGNAKMPAGSYVVRQSSFSDTNVLEIQSKDGSHSAFIEVSPTHADETHKNSDVTFNRYNNVDFLRRAWVGGQKYGYRVDETKAEEHSAAKTKATEHSVSGTAE